MLSATSSKPIPSLTGPVSPGAPNHFSILAGEYPGYDMGSVQPSWVVDGPVNSQ